MKKIVFIAVALIVSTAAEAKLKVPQQFRLKLTEQYFLDETTGELIDSRVIEDDSAAIIVSLTEGYVVYNGVRYPIITSHGKMKYKQYHIGAYVPNSGITIIFRQYKKWINVQVSIKDSPWIYYVAEMEEII